MAPQKFGILCFAPGFGGLEINTLRLASWMQAKGWEVPLLLRHGSAILKESQAQGLQATGAAAGHSRKDLKTLNHWVQSNGIKVLLIPFNKDIKLASVYKRFFNRKIRIIYQQHMQVGVSKRDLVHTLRYAMLDAWISPLQYLRDETIQKTRVPAHKIVVIPFGVDVTPFQASTWTQKLARQSLRLPLTPKIIGVLGRIDPKKGQDLVVRAIEKLNQDFGKDYHLLLLGDATLNEGDAFSMQLMKLVQDLGLETRVHFRGYEPDVMQFFRAIDIFAMPSHGETFGMVTLEAMAAGVPVVGTGRDGTKEILQDGRFGYLFPLKNVDAFCRQIMAAEEGENTQKLVEAARHEVAAKYSYQEMTERIEQLIISLL